MPAPPDCGARGSNIRPTENGVSLTVISPSIRKGGTPVAIWMRQSPRIRNAKQRVHHPQRPGHIPRQNLRQIAAIDRRQHPAQHVNRHAIFPRGARREQQRFCRHQTQIFLKSPQRPRQPPRIRPLPRIAHARCVGQQMPDQDHPFGPIRRLGSEIWQIPRHRIIQPQQPQIDHPQRTGRNDGLCHRCQPEYRILRHVPSGLAVRQPRRPRINRLTPPVHQNHAAHNPRPQRRRDCRIHPCRHIHGFLPALPDLYRLALALTSFPLSCFALCNQ